MTIASEMNLPRHAEIWLPGYLRSRLWPRGGPPARVWLAIADHFEPFWQHADETQARARVALWRERWPEIAGRHADAAGRAPRYTFFYPQEEYRPELVDELAEMVHQGIAEVEVHLHHDGEGQQNFVDRMAGFTEQLRTRHGLLREQNGRLTFGFIHGNWALDNSLPGGRWCGLNNEITLLRQLGCYADFTMPSGNSPTQARTLNTIYWAVDDPQRPKSYDYGVRLEPGGGITGDLLMIPGPLGLRWAERLVPRMEKGELAGHDLPTPYRAGRWLALAPRIGQDVFLKLYTHGAQERNSAVLLAGALDTLFRVMEAACRSRGIQLYFVSTWEMYQVIESARQKALPALLSRLSPSGEPRCRDGAAV